MRSNRNDIGNDANNRVGNFFLKSETIRRKRKVNGRVADTPSPTDDKKKEDVAATATTV